MMENGNVKIKGETKRNQKENEKKPKRKRNKETKRGGNPK